MNAAENHEYAKFAQASGVDLADVRPLTHAQRMEKLELIVNRDDVPYPIALDKRGPYLDAARSGKLFAIGELSHETVDLGEFTNEQRYEDYTFEEHLSWACLIADQQKAKQHYACREFLKGEEIFEIGGGVIPDYYILNARTFQQTAWQLATVSMIIPAQLFFTCHSRRFFPVTTFMRPLGTDYLEEPDIGHDIAGHVATFVIPAVADVMKYHGEARNLIYVERDERMAAAKGDEKTILQIESETEELLVFAGRIYWFTVEFGLVMEDGELRDFGAGILSSPGETVYSISDPTSNRILIDPSNDADLLRIANTDYLISEYQKTYFISKSFDLLRSLTPERILKACKLAAALPDYTWREIVPGDVVVNVGSIAMSPNEKYYRLMAGQNQDECLNRSALKNLALYRAGIDDELFQHLKAPPPEIPDEISEWFRNTYPTFCNPAAIPLTD